MDESSDTNVGTIPNPLKFNHNIYKSLAEQKLAHSAIFRSYFGDSGNSDDSNHFIKNVKVAFADQFSWDIEFDHKNRGVIFWHKNPTGDNAEEIGKLKDEITHAICMEYSTKINSTIKNDMDSIWVSIKQPGRDDMITEEKARVEKNDTNNDGS